MPCYMTGSREGDLELSLSETRANAQLTNRLLCSTLECLDPLTITTLPKDVQRWWAKHQRIDAQRKEREEIEQRRQELKRKHERELAEFERRNGK